MDNAFPGPFCRENLISCSDLENAIPLNPVKELSNGLVLEINSFLEQIGKNSQTLFNVLSQLDTNLKNSDVKSLKCKVSRINEQKKKLVSKKKVPGYKNVQDLLNKPFTPYKTTKKLENNIPNVATKSENNDCLVETIQQIEKISVSCETKTKTNSVGIQVYHDSKYFEECDITLVKDTNLLQYNNAKQQKLSQNLNKKIDEQTEYLESLKNKVGHYSIRNVNKRDETAKKNLHELRNLQRLVIKQEKLLKLATEKLKDSESSVKALSQDNTSMKDKISDLTLELEFSSKVANSEKTKKVNAQKANSYLRNEVQTLRQQIKVDGVQDIVKSESKKCYNCEGLKEELKDKENQITAKEQELDELKSVKLKTKNENGSYSNEVRLCVMELAGLEVAVEKVSPVIQCISHHLFNTTLSKSDLPNPTTTQSIVDEGHFIAKTFISDKLDRSENWGLGRDGTTRRKQKILDTSITLYSGDVISLGFNRVCKENAVTINEVTKTHLNELGKLNNSFNKDEDDAATFVARSLEKLSFTMSDRASNEKLANKILDEWRDQVLQDFDGDKDIVHNFHCMAHVLLGFHSYTTPGIKTLEQELIQSEGPLGRDSLPIFKSWSKKESVTERVVRTASEVFGPAGDHHGVRDKWEAYCAVNGIKSVVSNYKDNRFNAIFENAAEIFVHSKDFITVLDKVEKPNLKLKAVKKDLESESVLTLLQCFGIFYVKVTGPYWNLVTSGKVMYLELSPHVNELKDFLERCIDNPQEILKENEHWSSTDPLEIKQVNNHERFWKSLFTVDEKNRDLLLKAVSVVAAGMTSVINKQLVDFLEGGKFFNYSDENQKKRTKFAMVTNLGCEHHFGDLDASQRRRPSATMHHHSSVQLLKRNRVQMMKWIYEMKGDERNELMQTAKQGGRDLRKMHVATEKQVVSDIHHEMFTQKSKKDKKRKLECSDTESKRRTVCGEESRESNSVDFQRQRFEFSVNEYVAIAYQDAWYPGFVENVNDDTTAIVNFMAPCKKEGCFQWPARMDRQTVDKQFILQKGFVPDLCNSGRQWYIKEYAKICELFEEFQYLYFD